MTNLIGDDILTYEQWLTVPGATPDNGGTICEGVNNLAQVTCGFSDPAPPAGTGSSHAFIGSPEGQDGEN